MGKKNPCNVISRREFIKRSAAIAASTMLLPSAWLPPRQRSSPKNIVFIISDQHRYDAASCYGNEYIDTPNLDRLASEGVRFENMYCQFPLCVPSRMSIITSQYPSTHGTRKNYVPKEQYTLIDYLHDDWDYHTWLSGKSHMTTKAFDICIDRGSLDKYLPEEVIEARKNADRWYSAQYEGLEEKENRQKFNTQYLLYPLIEDWHRESLFVSMVKRILTEHSERPVFLWISFIKPHPKWTPPERFWQKYKDKQVPIPEPVTPEIIRTLPSYKRKQYYKYYSKLTPEDITNSVKAYYACTEYMDYCVGLVLDLLEQHNLVNETLVVYTADHGEMLGHNGLYKKGCFYEPAVHIPCIMRYPGVIPAGQVVSQCTEQIDLMPTLLDFAGIPPQGMEQGVSMRNLIMNPDDPSWKNEAFSEVRDNYIMIRTGRWKYNYYPGDTDQLFDLVNDPDERINLIDDPQYDDIKENLRSRIADRFGVSVGVGSNNRKNKPASYTLEQNCPNPFNATTTIRFTLPHRERVTLDIFDVTGRQIDTPISGIYDRGTHSVTWDASGVPSGTYFYKLHTEHFSQVRQMIVVK